MFWAHHKGPRICEIIQNRQNGALKDCLLHPIPELLAAMNCSFLSILVRKMTFQSFAKVYSDIGRGLFGTMLTFFITLYLFLYRIFQAYKKIQISEL